MSAVCDQSKQILIFGVRHFFEIYTLFCIIPDVSGVSKRFTVSAKLTATKRNFVESHIILKIVNVFRCLQISVTLYWVISELGSMSGSFITEMLRLQYSIEFD